MKIEESTLNRLLVLLYPTADRNKAPARNWGIEIKNFIDVACPNKSDRDTAIEEFSGERDGDRTIQVIKEAMGTGGTKIRKMFTSLKTALQKKKSEWRKLRNNKMRTRPALFAPVVL